MNSFLRACGLSEPLQLAIHAPTLERSEVRLLQQPFALVGRDRRADVSLEHREVSRRHVYLQAVEGKIFWIDLESRTGTSSDGHPRKTGWLEAGQPLEVGPFELQRLDMSDPTARGQGRDVASSPRLSPLVACAHPRGPLPKVNLEFLNGPSLDTCWPMNRVMSLIGSTEGCKFRLSDPSVSPFHCSLVRTPAGLWVVDLLGSDSVSVNDVPVRHAPLTENDVLRVGRYKIRIQCRFPRGALEALGAPRTRPAQVAIGGGGTGMAPAGAHTGSLAPWSAAAGAGTLKPLSAPGDALSVDRLTPVISGPIQLEAKGELAESVLVPLVNQFGLMQQQMLDQFQQAIATLVQMFGGLHRDQMELIREELDQLRDLTREFHALKQDLSARAQGSSAAPGPVATTAASLGDAAASRPRPPLEERAAANIVKAATGDRPASTAAAAPSTGPPPVEPVRPAPAEPPVRSAGSPGVEAPGPTSPPPRAAAEAAGSEADKDVIIWIHQRMMKLQQERETRWQKILKLLPGLS